MPQLQQARAVATREKILRGGAKVFAAKGYDGATVSDIVEASGVTKGAMYFHFPSKEHLGRAIVMVQTETVDRFTIVDSLCAVQQIVDISFDFGIALQTDPLMRASVRMATEGHGFDDEQRQTFDKWLHLGSQLAELGLAQGDIRSMWTPREVAETITTGVNGAQQSSLIFSNYDDMLQRLNTFWRMISPGLLTPSGIASVTVPG